MKHVYLIGSERDPKESYIGITSDLKKRLLAHSVGKTNHTVKFKPWKLVTFIALLIRRRRYPSSVTSRAVPVGHLLKKKGCGNQQVLTGILIEERWARRKECVRRSQKDKIRDTVVQSHREGAGPCAAGFCEPRQVRKEATVNRRFWVPQDHLAPFKRMLKMVTSFVLASFGGSTYQTAYASPPRSLRLRHGNGVR